jgi:large subunit ribosomal protein L3
MTQVYHPKDKGLYDVTIVKAGPCQVLRVKTADSKDGYNAVQLSYGQRKEKNISKAQLGQFKKAGASAARWIKEIRVTDTKGLEAGQTVVVDVPFKAGDYVDVQGTSKGKGFAGVMKRHNFLGMPASHGASDKERSPGSLASRRSLGRVLPGQRMAGHMGAETVTMQKLEIVQVDAEKNLIYVNGSVPGPKGGFVIVHETVKVKKFRTEIQKNLIRKDKMGNIIKAAAPRAPKAK